MVAVDEIGLLERRGMAFVTVKCRVNDLFRMDLVAVNIVIVHVARVTEVVVYEILIEIPFLNPIQHIFLGMRVFKVFR